MGGADGDTAGSFEPESTTTIGENIVYTGRREYPKLPKEKVLFWVPMLFAT